MDLARGELRQSGRPLKLSPQPFKVLVLLVSQAGRLVSREEVKRHVWGEDTFVDFEHGLNFCVRQIRTVLEDDAGHPTFIETVPRRGYRFMAPVEAGAPPSSETQFAEPPAEATARSRVRPRHPLRSALIALTALTVVVALGAALLHRARLGPRTPNRIQSVAVLPFANLSHDPNEEYFADGMTDELIASLSRLESIKVISRTSVMHYKGTAKPLPEIARELNVDAVIEASVLQSGGKVRIIVQLIQAATDQHLWSGTYEQQVSDVLALQAAVAHDVAQQISLQFSPEQTRSLASTRTVDPQAHEAYLKGRYFWNRRTAEGFLKAKEYFSEAIQRDPEYALAYAGLADTYLMLGEYNIVAPRDAYPKAREAATKALRFDETLCEAHATLAVVNADYAWNWAAAESEFQRALALNPNYATAHQWYGEFLMAMGRMDQAREEMERARTLDPLSLIINVLSGARFYFARDYDAAIGEYRKTLDLDANFVPAYMNLSLAYAQKGSYSEAIASLQTARRLSSGGSGTALLAYAYARSGDKQQARRMLQELQSAPPAQYVSPVDMAIIYIGLGDKDSALQWLEVAFQQRNRSLIQLNTEPLFDDLRADPRFHSLCRKIGL